MKSVLVVLDGTEAPEEVLPLLQACGARLGQEEGGVLAVVLAGIGHELAASEEVLELLAAHYQALLHAAWRLDSRVLLPTLPAASYTAAVVERMSPPTLVVGGSVAASAAESGGAEHQSAAEVLASAPAPPPELLKLTPPPLTLASGAERRRGTGGVLLGGTFDHMHAGHRLMLSAALFEAGAGTVAVGVTTAALLQKKRFAEHLHGQEERMEAVRAFLELGKHPQATLDLFFISDPYGPALTTQSLHAMVASRETETFVREKINAVRVEAGLPPLCLLSVGLLQAPAAMQAAGCEKLSSTQFRAAEAAAADEETRTT